MPIRRNRGDSDWSYLSGFTGDALREEAIRLGLSPEGDISDVAGRLSVVNQQQRRPVPQDPRFAGLTESQIARQVQLDVLDVERQNVSRMSQRELWAHSQGRGKPIRDEAGRFLPMSQMRQNLGFEPVSAPMTNVGGVSSNLQGDISRRDYDRYASELTRGYYGEMPTEQQEMLAEYQQWGYGARELEGLISEGGLAQAPTSAQGEYLNQVMSARHGPIPEGVTRSPTQHRYFMAGKQARDIGAYHLPPGQPTPRTEEWQEYGKEVGLEGPGLFRQGGHTMFRAEQAMYGGFLPAGPDPSTVLVPFSDEKLYKRGQLFGVHETVDVYSPEGERLTHAGSMRSRAATRPEQGITLRTFSPFEEIGPSGGGYYAKGSVGLFSTMITHDQPAVGNMENLSTAGQVWDVRGGQQVRPYAGAAPVDVGGWQAVRQVGEGMPYTETSTNEEGEEVSKKMLRFTYQRVADPSHTSYGFKTGQSKITMAAVEQERFTEWLGGREDIQAVLPTKSWVGHVWNYMEQQTSETLAGYVSKQRGETITAEQYEQLDYQDVGADLLSYFRENLAVSKDEGGILDEVTIGGRKVLGFVSETFQVPEMYSPTKRPKIPFRQMEGYRRAAEATKEGSPQRAFYQKITEESAETREAYSSIIRAAAASTGKMGAAQARKESVVLTQENISEIMGTARDLTAEYTEHLGITDAEQSRQILNAAILTGLEEQVGGRSIEISPGKFVASPRALGKMSARGEFEESGVGQLDYRLANVISRMEGSGEITPDIERSIQSLISGQEEMAEGKNFLRTALAGHPTSAVGGTQRISEHLAPSEAYLRSDLLLRAYGLKPGSAKARAFEKAWEEGKIDPRMASLTHPSHEKAALVTNRMLTRKQLEARGVLESPDTPQVQSMDMAQAHASDADGDRLTRIAVGEIRDDPTDPENPIKIVNALPLTSDQEIRDLGQLAIAQGAQDLRLEMLEGKTLDEVLEETDPANARVMDASQFQEAYMAGAAPYEQIGSVFNLFEKVKMAGDRTSPEASASGEDLFQSQFGVAQRPQELEPYARDLHGLLSTMNPATGGFKTKTGWESDKAGAGLPALGGAIFSLATKFLGHAGITPETLAPLLSTPETLEEMTEKLAAYHNIPSSQLGARTKARKQIRMMGQDPEQVIKTPLGAVGLSLGIARVRRGAVNPEHTPETREKERNLLAGMGPELTTEVDKTLALMENWQTAIGKGGAPLGKKLAAAEALDQGMLEQLGFTMENLRDPIPAAVSSAVEPPGVASAAQASRSASLGDPPEFRDDWDKGAEPLPAQKGPRPVVRPKQKQSSLIPTIRPQDAAPPNARDVELAGGGRRPPPGDPPTIAAAAASPEPPDPPTSGSRLTFEHDPTAWEAQIEAEIAGVWPSTTPSRQAPVNVQRAPRTVPSRVDEPAPLQLTAGGEPAPLGRQLPAWTETRRVSQKGPGDTALPESQGVWKGDPVNVQRPPRAQSSRPAELSPEEELPSDFWLTSEEIPWDEGLSDADKAAYSHVPPAAAASMAAATKRQRGGSSRDAYQYRPNVSIEEFASAGKGLEDLFDRFRGVLGDAIESGQELNKNQTSLWKIMKDYQGTIEKGLKGGTGYWDQQKGGAEAWATASELSHEVLPAMSRMGAARQRAQAEGLLGGLEGGGGGGRGFWGGFGAGIGGERGGFGEGAAGIGAGLGRMATIPFRGWEMQRLSRMWRMTGGYAMGQIPAAAQQEQAAMQAGLAGMPMGQTQLSGMATDLMGMQARQSMFRADVGRAAYGAWGWTQQAGGQGLATAAGIGLPAIGAGLVGGSVVGAGFGVAAGLTAGAGIAGAGLLVGATMYGMETMGDREKIALASGGGTGWIADVDDTSSLGQWENIWRGKQGNIYDRFLAMGYQQQQRAPLHPSGQSTLVDPNLDLPGYKQQLMSGELAGLPPEGRAASIMQATRDVAPEWMDPNQAMGLSQQWMQLTPDATNIRDIYQNPMFEQMGMRGLQPGQMGRTAQQFGMSATDWMEILRQQMGVAPAEATQTEEILQQWAPLQALGVGGRDLRETAYQEEWQARADDLRERGGQPGPRPAGMPRLSGTDATRIARLGGGDRLALSMFGAGNLALSPEARTFAQNKLGLTPEPWMITQEPTTGLPLGTTSAQYYSGNLGALETGAAEQGTWGIQWAQANLQEQSAQQRWGYQQQQFQRGYAAQTGGMIGGLAQTGYSAGLMSQLGAVGGMQGLQNQMVATQYANQMTDFGFAQRSAGLQRSQFMENWDVRWGRLGIENQQAEEAMDRSGQRQGIQDEQWLSNWNRQQTGGALEFGWRMEDYAENIRFTTGRQRMQLEKGRDRDVIRESRRISGAEEDKDYWEKLKELRDEDFEDAKEKADQRREWAEEDMLRSKKHFEESAGLQADRLSEQIRQYKEIHSIQETQRKLQQAMWKEDQTARALQMKEENALAEMQRKYNRDNMRLQQDSQAIMAKSAVHLMNMGSATESIDGSVKSITDTAERLRKIAGGSSSSRDTGVDWYEEHEIPLPGEEPVDPGTGSPIDEWMQMGGPVGGGLGGTNATVTAMLHAGEFVVPEGGQLVSRDERVVDLLQQIADLLVEGNGRFQIIVQNPDEVLKQTTSITEEVYAV